jgi:hypothetical protein
MLVAIKIKYLTVSPGGPEISHVYVSEISKNGNELSGSTDNEADILDAQVLDLTKDADRELIKLAYSNEEMDGSEILKFNPDPSQEGWMTKIGIETVLLEQEGLVGTFIEELARVKDEKGREHRTTCLLEAELHTALTKLAELLPNEANLDKAKALKFDEVYALPVNERIMTLAALSKRCKFDVVKLHEQCMKPENHNTYLKAIGMDNFISKSANAIFDKLAPRSS